MWMAALWDTLLHVLSANSLALTVRALHSKDLIDEVLQVAIKFEHVSSKGCLSNGKPAEWSVYNAIDGCHGVPKLYAKGTKGNFHIMVSNKVICYTDWECHAGLCRG